MEKATTIQLPLVYKQLIESPKPYVLLYSGRLGGKSNNTALIAVLCMLENPYHDIIVARVSYGSLADSSYSELEAAIDQFPESIREDFILKKSPLRIERKGNAGTIYFIGYGGSNTSRTKSIRPKHKIKMVILEETQELKDKRNLDEALASFRRNFGDNVKVWTLGNPPPQEAHWFNLFTNEKQFDPDWEVKKVSWMDIACFINDYDLKDILKTKLTDPDYYNWFYMGQTYSSYGSVYPMFRKERHVITPQDFDYCRENGLKVVGVVIGGDGAVNRDATAFVPILLLNNGQSVIGPIFYHNPKDDGVISYHNLVQNNLTRWFDELCRRYGLGRAEDKRLHPNAILTPIWMRIDCAAPDLIAECRFFFGDRCDVGPIKKLHVNEMVGVCQSTIANSNMYIIDYGCYFDYQQNRLFKTRMNLLAEQISMLVWNEKQNNYDPIVPNDVCDAWTYGNYFWYSNQENIQYFNIIKQTGYKNELISAILKNKGEFTK